MGTRPDDDEKTTKAPGTSAGGGGAPAADRAPDAAAGKDAPAPGDRDGGVADEANYMNPKPEDEVAPGADRGRPKQE